MTSLSPIPRSSIYVDSTIGNFRSQNEDTYVVSMLEIGNDVIELFGVFDGHGGIGCSHFIQENIENMLETKIQQTTDLENIKQSIVDACIELNDKFLSTEEGYMTGSCAIMGFLFKPNTSDNYNLLTANIGDSRGLLAKNSPPQVKTLSRDHKPYDPREKEYIESHGGKVLDGRIRGLAVSRAFGDKDIIEYGLRVEPEFDLKVINSSSNFFIYASDGLWDVMSNDEVIEFVNDNSRDNIANQLVEEALLLGSRDNITVIIGFLDNIN